MTQSKASVLPNRFFSHTLIINFSFHTVRKVEHGILDVRGWKYSQRERVAHNAFENRDMMAFMMLESLLYRAYEDICQPKDFWMSCCFLRELKKLSSYQGDFDPSKDQPQVLNSPSTSTDSVETSSNMDESYYRLLFFW